jgi:hypothetical protein
MDILQVSALVGMIVVLGGLGLMLGLSAAWRNDEAPAEGAERQTDRSRFFVLRTEAPALGGEVPVELLLSRLEQHVRQERAAVECFPDQPRAEDLRSRTSSPLVN